MDRAVVTTATIRLFGRNSRRIRRPSCGAMALASADKKNQYQFSRVGLKMKVGGQVTMSRPSLKEVTTIQAGGNRNPITTAATARYRRIVLSSERFMSCLPLEFEFPVEVRRIGDGENPRDNQDHVRDGRGQAQVPDLVGLKVQVVSAQIGRVPDATDGAEEEHDGVERSNDEDSSKEQGNGNERGQPRERNESERLPRARPVHPGGLKLLQGNSLQPGEKDEDNEGGILPHLDDDDGRDRKSRRGCPE